MAKELIYTSAPRGLYPGTSGFCTVQASAGISRPVIEMLESLSNHFRVPSTGTGTRGITAISCLRARVGTADVRVVSRNAAAPADYSGRSNNLAHHLVIEGNESPPIRNAAALAQVPGLLIKQWDGNVLTLPPRKLTSIGAADTAARTWKAVTGDAGWARFVATAWLADESPLHLIVDSQVDLLPLLAEAIEQMPESRRADATFTTYYSGLPLGITCQLRGVLAGSEQEATARKQRYLVLADLVGKPAPEAKSAAIASVEADEPLGSPLQTRSAASLKGLVTVETKKGPPQVQSQLGTLTPFRPGVYKVMAAAILASLLVNIGLGVLVALPAKEVAEVTQMLKEQAEKEKETIREVAKNELKTFGDNAQAEKEAILLQAKNDKIAIKNQLEGEKTKISNAKHDLEKQISSHRRSILDLEDKYQSTKNELENQTCSYLFEEATSAMLKYHIDNSTIKIGRLIFLPERTSVTPRDWDKDRKNILKSNVRIFLRPNPAIDSFGLDKFTFVEFAPDGMVMYSISGNDLKYTLKMNIGVLQSEIELYFQYPGDYTTNAKGMNIICQEMFKDKALQLTGKYKKLGRQEPKDPKDPLNKDYYYHKFDFSNLK